jgi:hypothetical protein
MRLKLHAKPRRNTFNEKLNLSLCGRKTTYYALDEWVTCRQCLKKLDSLRIKAAIISHSNKPKLSEN